MVFGVKETISETSDNLRTIFEAPRTNNFKFLSRFVQDLVIVMKNFTLKIKPKKFFFDQIFFSSKIISNDQICFPIDFLRCLELPWKLWKQNIYVKSSIFLKIRLFHQNLMKSSKFLTWPRLFKLRNAMGSLQILD